MKYFTKKGVNQVKEKYKTEKGKKFYFDDSNVKHKLVNITEQKTNYPDCFLILFMSDKLLSKIIDEFMKLNDLKYDFNDFETKHIDV